MTNQKRRAIIADRMRKAADAYERGEDKLAGDLFIGAARDAAELSGISVPTAMRAGAARLEKQAAELETKVKA